MLPSSGTGPVLAACGTPSTSRSIRTSVRRHTALGSYSHGAVMAGRSASAQADVRTRAVGVAGRRRVPLDASVAPRHPNCHPERVTGDWSRAMTEPEIRTAVVMVHGMGEQVPLETVNHFVKTALPRTGEPPTRQYFSRPDVVSGSYEARKMSAYAQPVVPTAEHPRVHDRFDFYEYHWAYKMTGNHLGDFLPTLWRLLWR